MSATEFNDSSNGSSDKNASRPGLECIGSFHAYTQSGEQHTIEIWTHFVDVPDRNTARVAPTLLVLTTTAGHDVEHIAKGQYRLKENPEVSLSTDDPDAP